MPDAPATSIQESREEAHLRESTPPGTPFEEIRNEDAEVIASVEGPGISTDLACHHPLTSTDAVVPSREAALTDALMRNNQEAFFPGEAYFDIGRREMEKWNIRIIFHDWIVHQIELNNVPVSDRRGKLPLRLSPENLDPSGTFASTNLLMSPR